MEEFLFSCQKILSQQIISGNAVCVFLTLFQILLCIFKKARQNQNQYNSNWKCCYNCHRLKTVHRIFRKNQSNRKQNKQHSPEGSYPFVRFFICLQEFIRIRRDHHGKCIKSCRIKSKEFMQ